MPDSELDDTVLRMTKRLMLAVVTALMGAASLVRCVQTPEREGDPIPTRSDTPTPIVGVDLVTKAPPTSVVLVFTAEPPPTATITPTPTPFLYTIESGDTLLAIAIDHGTTTEEILGLNPGIRPELLQIGQQIILPPPALTAVGMTEDASEPIDVEILSLTAYRSPFGGSWVLGEAVNRGRTAIENVQVALHWPAALETSAQGYGNNPARTWLALQVIPPGQRSPFGVLVREDLTDSQGLAATIVGGQQLASLGDRYLGLEVREADVNIEDNSVSIVAEVVNSGDAIAEQIQIVATFYGPDDRVVGFSTFAVGDFLGPGLGRTFAVETSVPGGGVVDYAFVVQGLRQ